MAAMLVWLSEASSCASREAGQPVGVAGELLGEELEGQPGAGLQGHDFGKDSRKAVIRDK